MVNSDYLYNTFDSIHPVGECSLLCGHVGYNLDIIIQIKVPKNKLLCLKRTKVESTRIHVPFFVLKFDNKIA